MTSGGGAKGIVLDAHHVEPCLLDPRCQGPHRRGAAAQAVQQNDRLLVPRSKALPRERQDTKDQEDDKQGTKRFHGPAHFPD